ncbi:translocation/assembly module TamB domain-containing protein, partial [Delftia tsuruhatensis]
ARLSVRAQGDDVQAKLDWDSERAGTLTAQLGTRLAQQDGTWTWPEKAPLSGQIDARMPDIGIWALFAPPGWRVTGSLQAKAEISGDRQNPQWQGNLSADGLSILSALDGIDLQNGVLRARLQGNRLDLTELRMQGGRGSNARILGYSGNLTTAPREGGELTGSGFVRWDPPNADGSNSGLSMDLRAQATRLQVLVRADRQVSVSGGLQARLEQGQFTLRGDLTTDRATIILPEESAPSLDSDVVVHSAASRKAEQEAARKQQQADRKAQARAETIKLPDILVKLDLGRDFALQGYGITTRLEGALEVQGPTVAGGPPRITGEIRTVQGRYRAWGQSLDVETGLIRFNGPYANPSLDILALRPNIAVRAGVQVQGTANAPRVRLYSDPEMPDAEKLSWVVMGRDPATGGAESALLQQAALSLLSGGRNNSGKIASNLGLDEIGFKGPGGEGSTGAALTLGKRLSSDLYVTYEQSLSGAMGTLYIFYDLSRRLTLRGQTGETSALDLIYTVRKD